MLGELIPEGGGDPIPLLKDNLIIGRRDGCDVVLKFSNVSSHHCELSLEEGYWFVKDLGSRNGTRVNGFRVNRKRIDPGDRLRVAKHTFRVSYSPQELGAVGPPPEEDVMSEILSRSLLEGAGLNRKSRQRSRGSVGRSNPNDSGSPRSGGNGDLPRKG